MADIVLAGNTSGTVTLSAPDVAGTTTLNLPASSGTVLDDASVGVCRAWVNFNGTGTVAIRASFNVSSITDNGTGDYTTNFTTAMADADYAVGGTGASVGVVQGYLSAPRAVAPTTSAVRICTLNNSGTLSDLSYVYVAIFR